MPANKLMSIAGSVLLALGSQIRSAMLANAIDDEPIIDMKDSLSGISVKFDLH